MEPRTVGVVFKDYKLLDDTVFVTFQLAEPFEFSRGSHAILEFVDPLLQDSGRRKFALLKEEKEDEVSIAFLKREPLSEFKTKVLSSKPGDLFRLTGPLGDFTWKSDTKPIFAIAKEIGASSLVALLSGACKDRHLEAFYYTSKTPIFDTLFNERVDQSMWRYERNASLEEIQKQCKAFYHIHENNGYYYLSGVQSFIDEMRLFLKELGVRDSSIKEEVYLGY